MRSSSFRFAMLFLASPAMLSAESLTIEVDPGAGSIVLEEGTVELDENGWRIKSGTIRVENVLIRNGASARQVMATMARPQARSPEALSGEVLEMFRIAVQECWVVDVGSRAANVKVVLRIRMNRDGTLAGPVRKISATGGDAAAQQTAFEAARRAVLRCQRGGYDLPVEKYDHWREFEMTFDPANMRLR